MSKYSIKNEYVKVERKCNNKKNKKCLYPGCESMPIRSHSIQMKKLRLIAPDGMLITRNKSIGQHSGYKFFKFSMEKIGKKTASTFKGFCREHDSKLFFPIENEDYENTNLQNFLFAYRSIAHRYIKWMEITCIYHEYIKILEEQIESSSTLLEPMRNSIKETNANTIEKRLLKYEKVIQFVYKGYLRICITAYRAFLSGIQLVLNTIETNLQKFSKILGDDESKRNYDILKSKVYEFPLSLFSMSEIFGIMYDLEGNSINTPLIRNAVLNIFGYQNNISHADTPSESSWNNSLHPLFCNAFPQNGKTYVVFSYFESCAPYYDVLFKQMDSGKYDIEEVISNMSLRYTENFFVAKEKYNALTKRDRSKLNNLFNFVSPIIDKYSLRKKAPLNLFQVLKD